MAAQNQARMAGVSYDVIDESQLTNINNLVGYDALIFPAMPDVNSALLPAITSTLTNAVNDHHISIITAGDFLTNDQAGAALPTPYADMQTLLGLTRSSGGTGTVQITANDVSNPIMQGYTAGQVIQNYANESYSAYTGVGGVTPDVLVNQNVTGVGMLPGVVETTTGGTNVHFATADLEGDSNLLSLAIQSVVLGTQPGVALHTSRMAGIVAARMDMDQSQFPADVSPAAGAPGIYDKLIPVLQQWKQAYNFVGSYYINIGDSPSGINGTEVSTTNWVKSLPYYKAIQATGGEIGNHTYTHLINPPTTTAATTADAPAGSTQVTLAALPSIEGITVGLTVTLRRSEHRREHDRHCGVRQHRDHLVPGGYDRQGELATYRRHDADLREFRRRTPTSCRRRRPALSIAQPAFPSPTTTSSISRSFSSSSSWARRSTVPPFQVPRRHTRPPRTSFHITSLSPQQRQHPDTPAM